MTQGELELDRHYIKRLEQRIAELEDPMNCEGCNYFGGMDFCRECSRNESNKFNDYYEPKDTKCQTQLN